MPKRPDPYEVRGTPRKLEEVQRVWAQHYGYEQLSMFAPQSLEIVVTNPPPSQSHSPTSRAAALLIEGIAGTLRGQIYTLLLGCLPDGLTDEEAQERLSLQGNTYRPRRVELEEAGLVRDSKTTRLTKARRKAVVWVAVPVEDLPGNGVVAGQQGEGA